MSTSESKKQSQYKDNLDIIKEMFDEHINDLGCVFKLCLNQWLVVMRKRKDTVSDEGHRRCMGDCFTVLAIVDIDYPKKTIDALTNVLEPRRLTNRRDYFDYVKNTVVKGEKSSDYWARNHIDDYGIEYFKDIEMAYYDREVPKNYTGKWSYWNSESKLTSICYYHLGQLNGEATNFHDNGEIKEHGDYCDGKRIGKWVSYHDNKVKESEFNYRKGEIHGLVPLFHNDGSPHMTLTFVNGKPEGELKSLHKDGKKHQEGQFKNGKLVGKYIALHSNGLKEAEGEYNDEGKKIGKWYRWYDNAGREEEIEFEPKYGLMTGVWSFWDKDGKMKAINDHGRY